MQELKTRENVEAWKNQEALSGEPQSVIKGRALAAARQTAKRFTQDSVQSAGIAYDRSTQTGEKSANEENEAEHFVKDTYGKTKAAATGAAAWAIKHRASVRAAAQKDAAAPSAAKKFVQAKRRALEQFAQDKMKRAAAQSKAAAHILKNKLKEIALANKFAAALLAAGACICLLFILLMMMTGAVTHSALGVFFSNESGDMTMRAVVQELTEEYYDRVADIEASVPHDFVETEASDGDASIHWPEVLAVYAAQNAESGETVTLDESRKEQIRIILKEMNELDYHTYTTTREEEVPVSPEEADEDGADSGDTEEEEDTETDTPETETITITETHLVIEITHHTSEEMSSTYAFTAYQQQQLALLRQPKYEAMWLRLLGGFASGGQILAPAEGGSLINGYSWPLTIPGSLSSGFGYREDPITGETKYHAGIDIAAPEGTPVLAVSDGMVIAANGADAWGGGYGYYVHVQHSDGSVTVYAHCSAICATTGQTVQRGEVIAYVGSTGKSTGNHLHFEVQSYAGAQNPQVSNLL